jgi:hypothetical protein
MIEWCVGNSEDNIDNKTMVKSVYDLRANRKCQTLTPSSNGESKLYSILNPKSMRIIHPEKKTSKLITTSNKASTWYIFTSVTHIVLNTCFDEYYNSWKLTLLELWVHIFINKKKMKNITPKWVRGNFSKVLHT